MPVRKTVAAYCIFKKHTSITLIRVGWCWVFDLYAVFKRFTEILGVTWLESVLTITDIGPALLQLHRTVASNCFVQLATVAVGRYGVTADGVCRYATIWLEALGKLRHYKWKLRRAVGLLIYAVVKQHGHYSILTNLNWLSFEVCKVCIIV